MKSQSRCAVVVGALTLTIGLHPAAAGAPLPSPAMVEQGPHHRVIRQAQEVLQPDGEPAWITNSWVALATGMARRQDNQWVECREQIELFQDGAIGGAPTRPTKMDGQRAHTQTR